jgi:RNA polymerase subunit RPABC4/transcription elongation factor Spt4
MSMKKTNMIMACDNMGECPYCGKTVDSSEMVCPHCGANLSALDDECPFCGRLIDSSDFLCPHCGANVYEYWYGED